MSDRWHAPYFKRLVWLELDGEHFIFNPLTGKTHYLNNLATAMLRHLADEALDAKELCLSIGADDLADCIRQTEHHLETLVNVGLVERC